MSDALQKRKRFKGQHGNDLSTEESSHKVDDNNHQQSDNNMAFERRKCHLLAQLFELVLSGSYLFLVTFVLRLDNMGIFEFLQLFV